MRISDMSSDVCSSDLCHQFLRQYIKRGIDSLVVIHAVRCCSQTCQPSRPLGSRVEKSVDTASGYAAVGANCAIVAPVAHTQQRDGSACRTADVHFIAPKGVSNRAAGDAYPLARLFVSPPSFHRKVAQPRDWGTRPSPSDR